MAESKTEGLTQRDPIAWIESLCGVYEMSKTSYNNRHMKYSLFQFAPKNEKQNINKSIQINFAPIFCNDKNIAYIGPYGDTDKFKVKLDSKEEWLEFIDKLCVVLKEKVEYSFYKEAIDEYGSFLKDEVQGWFPAVSNHLVDISVEGMSDEQRKSALHEIEGKSDRNIDLT